MMGEMHEHPVFNGCYHAPVWAKIWASTGTNDEPPEDTPITCVICGVAQGD